MSDCEVCIGIDNPDDYAEVCESAVKTARRAHKCCECGAEIKARDSYEHTVMKYEGEWLSYKTCLLCVEIRTVFTCGKSWLFTTLWDDMREYAFDSLTMASKCFVKLSPEAKTFTLARWRAWKGLAA